jgi:hypothetical protein
MTPRVLIVEDRVDGIQKFDAGYSTIRATGIALAPVFREQFLKISSDNFLFTGFQTITR